MHAPPKPRDAATGPWRAARIVHSNYVPAPQFLENMFHHALGWRAHRHHSQFRCLRSLVGRVETREMFKPPSPGLGIEALGIAPDAFVERSVDKNLDEFARLDQ